MAVSSLRKGLEVSDSELPVFFLVRHQRRMNGEGR